MKRVEKRQETTFIEIKKTTNTNFDTSRFSFTHTYNQTIKIKNNRIKKHVE